MHLLAEVVAGSDEENGLRRFRQASHLLQQHPLQPFTRSQLLGQRRRASQLCGTQGGRQRAERQRVPVGRGQQPVDDISVELLAAM